MTVKFDQPTILKLADGLENARYSQLRLEARVASRTYKTELGREYALQGLLRRSGLLLHSANRVYEAIPPELEGLPTREGCLEATVHLQASIFNTFGCLDNLAWLWVHEKSVRSISGKPIPPKRVGLAEKYTDVRLSLSPTLQAYLDTMKAWFDRLVGYRDALAHRIPLYVVPSIVSESNVDEYRQLDAAEIKATIERDWEEAERLAMLKSRLEVFQPFIAGSLREGPAPILFHAQIIADHATIVELSNLMVDELDRA